MGIIASLYPNFMGLEDDSRYESGQKDVTCILLDIDGTNCSLRMKEMDKKMFSPCILVVDHDVNQLVKLEDAFSRAGYRVLTAHESRQAIYLAQAARPEVIVCNSKMPAQKGSDVRHTLSQDSQTASIPFVFLNKPLDRQELVARVNAMIRSSAIH